MTQVVTVPGGNGVIITIPFTTSADANIAMALLQNIYNAALAEQNIVYAGQAGPKMSIPGDVNEFLDNVEGQVHVPDGFSILAADYQVQGAQYPTTSFIAGGTLDGSIIDITQGLTSFQLGTGAATVVAGGNVALSTLPSGSGGGSLYLDGTGTQTAALQSGTWSVVSGTGTGNFVLGTGNDTVYAEGTDTVRGAPVRT